MKNEVKPFCKVLVRNTDDECWNIDLYSCTCIMGLNFLTKHVCIGGNWSQIIIYKEELDIYIGTSDDIKGALKEENHGE